MTPDRMPASSEHCWKSIGVQGDRSCDQLAKHVHCRNCPLFRQAGRQLLNRSRPDDYVAELTQRLAEIPPDQSGQSLRLVIFRVENVWLALPAEHFEESHAPVPVIRVPSRGNRNFMGLVSLNGDLQLCFTLRHWLASDPIDAGSVESVSMGQQYPRLLMLRCMGHTWVFHVDEVLGTIAYRKSDLEAVPVNLARSPQQLVQALFSLDSLRIKLLDTVRLVTLFQEALV